MSARRALEQTRAPNEHAAEERAWTVVRSAYQARQAVIQPRSRARYLLAFAITLAVGVLGLSPAGATVGRLISRALGIQHAATALSSLPTSGTLLVSGPGGTWTVAADGSTRRLGPWSQANWSPHGRYLAVASDGRLTAIDPRGITQWTIARPNARDPRWFSPSGYRIAYLSNGQLRVIAGDGTEDHLVAAGVANVAPAWRPGHAYQLAYVTAAGSLLVRDGDSGRVLWARSARGTSRLQWSADGRYLLASSGAGARIYDARGAVIWRLTPPAGAPILDGALSPDGRLLALVLGGRSEQVVLADPGAARSEPHRALAGPGLGQVLFSPDSQWLLISWPAADQWVFVHVAGTTRIAAVSHIARQFASGSRGGAFPQLDGWCCAAHG